MARSLVKRISKKASRDLKLPPSQADLVTRWYLKQVASCLSNVQEIPFGGIHAAQWLQEQEEFG